VNGTLGVKTRNGDLYLVTGTDKASNWCLASYSNGSGESNILKFSSTDIDDTSATGQFLWESSGPIEARTCPVPGEGNQCAFVRGFKLALNETLYQKCFQSPTKTSHVSMSRPWWRRILWAIISRWYSRCKLEQTSAVLSDVTGGPHPVFKLESFPKLSEPYHPLDAINRHLLHTVSAFGRVVRAQFNILQNSEAKVAITHDDAWCSVITVDDRRVPDGTELLRRILNQYHSQREGDCVFLVPNETRSTETLRTS